ncbi:MAG: hypothetical protein A2277_06695 [Desulfobacterales bacterium RIFOXYA12_FULL_46_15]|nr:MAG: hypothetical protein A2277_06695 [Desulfobacterales bacterium RIFOXYA12_FULL_46_15]
MEAPVKKKMIFCWIDSLSELGGNLSAILLWIVAIVVTYEVAARYLFNAPTTWVQETSVYLCMGVGLLGAAYALKNDSHFGITIFVDKLSAKNRRKMQIASNVAGFAYSLTFVYQGFLQTKLSYDLEDVSNGLMATPLWIPWMLMPIGGVLLALQFISKIAEEISRGRSEGRTTV